MSVINVHEGKSDKGNYNSRGSHGCLTISPSASNKFFNNFDWSNKNGTTGNSSGVIYIYRGKSFETFFVRTYLNVKKWVNE
jgi:hypothetical protein